MEIHQFAFPIRPKSSWIHIEPLSDIHIGHQNFDEEKFDKCVERIRTDPDRWTILLGDLWDAVCIGDKRYDVQSADRDRFNGENFEDQYQFLLKKLAPIRDKIIGIHTGNHDEVMRKAHFEDYVLRMSKDLNVKYLGWLALTRLFFRKAQSSNDSRSLVMFSGHSGYTGQRAGGNLNRVEDLTASFNADIYLTGHSHQIVVDKRNILALTKNKTITGDYGLVEKSQVFAVCGSFLKSYKVGNISYPESKLMRTSRTGTITVSMRPYQEEIQAHE